MSEVRNRAEKEIKKWSGYELKSFARGGDHAPMMYSVYVCIPPAWEIVQREEEVYCSAEAEEKVLVGKYVKCYFLAENGK